jgi:hypothetical protein
MAIFNSYVKLPEGKSPYLAISLPPPTCQMVASITRPLADSVAHRANGVLTAATQDIGFLQ